MSQISDSIPDEVRTNWSDFHALRWRPIKSGLINQTYCGENSRGTPKAILQRLNPIFDPRVNIEIQAVTTHLDRKGIATPCVIPTDNGALWTEAEDGIWRALTYIHGLTFEKVKDRKMAFEAGKLVGRFHYALDDFEHQYHASRKDVHDTSAHVNSLKQALSDHRTHPLYSKVAWEADRVLSLVDKLPPLNHLLRRHTHGDLKISNLLFDKTYKGLCLIDLDTLCPMIWPFEMGDALRSWCNPNKEDEHPARLELEFMDGALAGYASTNASVSVEEMECLVPGLIQICLELSVRFLTDALNENYFAWDPARYPGHGEHSLVRGQAMRELWDSVNKQRSLAEQIVSANLKPAKKSIG